MAREPSGIPREALPDQARQRQAAQGVDEVHILWTSEGMSCDGDTVSMTAAMQPSIEDVVLGVVPGLPKVHLHNKVLSPSLGGGQGDFLDPFFKAARGELGPFILVVEGSIPNEKINGDGYCNVTKRGVRLC